MIHAGYKGSDHLKKNYITRYADYVYFLQCCHLHIPLESPKKAFY